MVQGFCQLMMHATPAAQDPGLRPGLPEKRSGAAAGKSGISDLIRVKYLSTDDLLQLLVVLLISIFSRKIFAVIYAVTAAANSLLFDYYQIGTITFAIKRLKSGVPSP